MDRSTHTPQTVAQLPEIIKLAAGSASAMAEATAPEREVQQNMWDRAQVGAYYNDFAQAAWYRATNQILLDLAGLANDSVVLELGCGTGTATRQTLAMLGERGRVIATDSSEPMLRIAEANLYGDNRVTLGCHDAANIDRYKGHGVTAITAFNALHLFSNVGDVLHRAHELLPAGSTFSFSSGLSADAITAENARDTIKLLKFLRRQVRELGESDSGSGGSTFGPSTLSAQEYEILFQRAGFTVRNVELRPVTLAVESVTDFFRVPGTGNYLIPESLPENQRERILSAANENFAQGRFERNWLYLVAEK